VRTAVLPALVVLLIGASTGVVAQQPLAMFKSAVAVVPISVVVHDSRGRVVTSLTSEDFEVLDKGEPRPILDFRAERDTPVTLGILIDTSGSMRISSKFALARAVVKQLSTDLEAGRDEVSLFTFDSTLRVEQPFTRDLALLNTALERTEPFGVTSLYDAIAETATRLADHGSARRAILVLTDGIDTDSALRPSEVSSLASSIDVPVYVVATVAPIDRAMSSARADTPGKSGGGDLRDLALWTGGDVHWVTRAEEAVAQARAIVSELRHTYLIMVESAAQPEWRPIDVRVRARRHLAVRARSGYFSR
jgi:Ca-activated chloride channel family protein